MDTFRAFVLDGKNRIVRSEILTVTTDDEALEAARALAEANDLEVWRGNRKIARISKIGDSGNAPRND